MNIKDIALFYVYHSLTNEIEITHLKLQKLLYYTQAYHLVYFDKQPLFEDEPEAWVNGPVYRAVYDKFKPLGVYNVISYKKEAEEKINAGYEKLKKQLEDNLTKEQIGFISSVYNHFGLMNHEKLVMLTHSEPPWNEARKGLSPFEYSNSKISLESMYNYYSKVLNKSKSNE